MLVHLLLVQENEENDDNDDDVVVDIPWRIPFPQVPWPNSRACVDWEIRIPHHYTCHKLQQPPTSIRGGNKNKSLSPQSQAKLRWSYKRDKITFDLVYIIIENKWLIAQINIYIHSFRAKISEVHFKFEKENLLFCSMCWNFFFKIEFVCSILNIVFR